MPIYATNAASQVAYVIEHCGARACFVEDNDQLAKVLLHRAELPTLEHVVVMEHAEPTADGFTRPLSQLRAVGAARLESEPERFDQFVDAVSPCDLATIVYTSGTTGRPKGAMITHANLMATMRSLASLIELRPTDRYLSFLPLSHITERCVSHFGQLASGRRDVVRPQPGHRALGPAGVPAHPLLRRAPSVGEVPRRGARARRRRARRPARSR